MPPINDPTGGYEPPSTQPGGGQIPTSPPGKPPFVINDPLDPNGGGVVDLGGGHKGVVIGDKIVVYDNSGQKVGIIDAGGSGGGGGGGGSGNPFAQGYYDLDVQKFDWDKSQDEFNNQITLAKFNADEAWRAAQIAMNQGNQELAQYQLQQKDYWEGVGAELQRSSQALTARGQDMDYAAQQAQLQQAAQDSANRYQIGMAQATNDAERNRVSLIHEQEMAAIAQMDNETKRALGLMEGQTNQFSAETARAYNMGQLALQNNQFLLNAASTPRDLFGAYFMQRGLAPDWNTAMAGGQLAQGDPLVPVNPMTAYRPVTLPYDFSKGLPENIYTGKVGQASNTQIAPNQFITGTQPQVAPVNLPQAPAYTPPAAPTGPVYSVPTGPVTPIPGVGGQAPKGEIGIRAADLSPGWNLTTTLPGGDFYRKDIGPGYKIYDENKNEITDQEAKILGNKPYWVYREA